MTAGTQTLAQIPSLAQLSQTGYRSPIVDATMAKWVAMERARLAQDVASLAERLRVCEERYQLASVDCSRRFQAGAIGDDADLFAWSAFSHMWVSALAQLTSLGHETTSWTPSVLWMPSKLTMATSAMVRQVDVVQERVAGDDGCLRARLVLTHNDCLEVSEFFPVAPGRGHTVEYRHQWMEQTRQVMRQRWDNATHSPGLPHFPHHIHGGEETRVEPGQPIGVVARIAVRERERDTTLEDMGSARCWQSGLHSIFAGCETRRLSMQKLARCTDRGCR